MQDTANPDPPAPRPVPADAMPFLSSAANGPGARMPARDYSPSLAGRLLGVLKREPVLFVTLTYILVSFMGIWSSYWFYRQLGLPILDYLQGSDLFIAGLRRPDFALILGCALLAMWLSALPLRWGERNPGRVDVLRRTRWWGPLAFPDRRSWMSLWGIRGDTLMLLGFLPMSMYLLYTHSDARARQVLENRGPAQRVQLVMAGGAAAQLTGDAVLLGTTSAFVMVWRPDVARVEAVPIAGIARIGTLGPLDDGPSIAARAPGAVPAADDAAEAAAGAPASPLASPGAAAQVKAEGAPVATPPAGAPAPKASQP